MERERCLYVYTRGPNTGQRCCDVIRDDGIKLCKHHSATINIKSQIEAGTLVK